MKEFFQDRGTLPLDAPSYVERLADAELFRLCQEGALAYVLAPRQTGKSSLVVRTRRRLSEIGIKSVYIDLTLIRTADMTADQWYLSLLAEIQEQLGLELELEGWWEERRHLTAVKRLSAFLKEEVLARVEERVVVFVDEIDSTLRLPFSADDLFAALRALHNARAMEPALERLSFVLLGVASPSDLISDPERTPFNVGEPVELGDFERGDEKVQVLLAGLDGGGDPRALLGRVFFWTDGHPRLTQKLCRRVVEREDRAPESVDSVVSETLLGAEGEKDETLREIRRQADRDPRARSWLPLYAKVLKGRGPEVDATSEEQTRLRLVGLVKGRPRERLRVRNRIFRRVFDADWTAGRLRRDPLRRRARLAMAVAALLGLITVTVAVIAPQIAKRKALFEQLTLDNPAASLDALDRLTTDNVAAQKLREIARRIGLDRTFGNRLITARVNMFTLITEYWAGPDKILETLRQFEPDRLVSLFDEGPGALPEGRRAEAVARAVEVAIPLVEEKPEHLALVGAMVWAIDYFVARDAALSDRAASLREAVLRPLRERAPPPDLTAFEWAKIPSGSFLMGSRQVTLGSFSMLAHEVTNRELRQLVPGHQGEDHLPATEADWYEAYAYAAWLGGRLPTEAEWEYAARAGCPHDYCDQQGKETTLDQVGWYREHPKFADSSPSLQRVRQLEPNPWGLYDLYGNVWEWVADWDAEYPEEPQVNPWGPPSGENRVVRGGGFRGAARWARAAIRYWNDPESEDVSLGFRVVLPAAPSQSIGDL